MANQPGWNPFNPLIIGAIAVILALAVFLVFREGSDQNQQTGIQSQPPAATSPAPGQTPQKSPALPDAAPTTPPAGGSGSQ